MPCNLDKLRACAWAYVLASGGPGSAHTFRQMSYGLEEGGFYSWLAKSAEFGAKYLGKDVVPFLRCPGGGWPNEPTDFAQLTYWPEQWVRDLMNGLSYNYSFVGIHLGAVRGMRKPERFGSVLLQYLELFAPLCDRLVIGLDECSSIDVDGPEHPQMFVARAFIAAGFTVIVEQGRMLHQLESWYPNVAGFITTRSQLAKRDSGQTNDFESFDGNGKLNVILGDDTPAGEVLKWCSAMRARGFVPAPEATTLSGVDAAAYVAQTAAGVKA